MTYRLTGAFFLAPKYYVPVDEKESPKHGGPAAFNWRTLEEGSILPAFTSLELFLGFVQTYYAGEGSTVPVHLNLKAFELADVLDTLEPEGVESVAIDPVSNRAGQWSDPWETMSADYFRRLAEEMRPGLASVAGSLRSRGLDAETICSVLLEVNQRRCQPPLAESEVVDIGRSICRYPPGSPRYRRSSAIRFYTNRKVSS